jgi:sugar O-acyltransferase (sialic acid O-acetyltransferase NeuD family)
MHTDDVFLVGAGGHGKVVLDALLECGIPLHRVRISDEAQTLQGTLFMGCRVDPLVLVDEMVGASFHIAIGTAHIRRRLFDAVIMHGALPLTVTHPAASVSRHSSLGAGCFVAAKSIIAPGAKLGNSVILNHGAIVDHDCNVGDFSHIAPNATLGGGVRVGASVLIGAGSTILPGIVIGAGAIIGAGAVVTTDIDAGETHVGVPAANIIGS